MPEYSFQASYKNLSDSFYSFVDLEQLISYFKLIKNLETPANRLEQAISYAREDAEINDLNHHLNSFYPELN